MKHKLSQVRFLNTKSSLLLFLIIIAAVLLAFPTDGVLAEALEQPVNSPLVETNDIGTDECLSCHQLPEMILPLADGGELYITVDPEAFAASVHGQQGKVCVDCHTEFTGYPHPDFTIKNRREVSIQLTQVCMTCHPEVEELYVKGRHAQEFVKGNLDTALCVDCHTSHQVKDIRGSKVEIAKTCRNCHTEIYDIYQDSVHGVALLDDQNFDVPTCSDCHENHDNHGRL
jgi:nitrate/TMAO reductase-like tetraheme cytochrome c subunit